MATAFLVGNMYRWLPRHLPAGRICFVCDCAASNTCLLPMLWCGHRGIGGYAQFPGELRMAFALLKLFPLWRWMLQVEPCLAAVCQRSQSSKGILAMLRAAGVIAVSTVRSMPPWPLPPCSRCCYFVVDEREAPLLSPEVCHMSSLWELVATVPANSMLSWRSRGQPPPPSRSQGKASSVCLCLR